MDLSLQETLETFTVLKLEKTSDGHITTIRLIGRMQSEHLAELKKQLEHPRFVLELNELTIVDVDVIRFLNTCELAGIDLLHCPRYVREWMKRENSEAGTIDTVVIH